MTAPDWVEAVLHFWFEELQPNDWFTKNEQLDETIRQRFLPLYEQLAQHVPPEVLSDARGVLAAVIVLDQFPRNMFRGSPRAFATDNQALALADQAIRASLDRQLSLAQRSFLCMPFQHCEDRATQARSVELFAKIDPNGLDYAQRHKDIVDRFGRFPHRNAVLGRPSTPEEIEFMKTHPGF